MSLRRTTPLTLVPRGLSDAIDGTNVFAGAMASLQNLIPDPSTRGVWQCRPAAIQLVDFGSGSFSRGFSSGFAVDGSAFASPVGMISCMILVGNVVYGMVASGPSNDVPFAYSLATNLFLPVGGVSGANVPTKPATSGAWTPPTMALVGANILVTHPGFNGSVSGNYIGWFDISDPTNIQWSAGNITGAITFSTPPSAVENFNGRAYWATNPPAGQPSLVFSDELVPRNVTNANQALTFDDNQPLTALAPLPLNNQLGGIVQALLVFKGVSNIYQVTGDSASGTLAKNALNVATGTLAPNSICPTPRGVLFAAPDGLRLIDFSANVSDPIGVDGMGKVLPFIYSLVPSRMCAAANGSIYRISLQDASLTGSPWVEYWYDIPRQIWSGPHTFAAAAIVAYQNTFIMAPHDVGGTLWQADYVQSSATSFMENGAQMTFIWSTVMLPDTNQMSENAMIESTLDMGLQPGNVYTVYALDENATVIQRADLAAGGTQVLWGEFVWGQGVWGGGRIGLFPRRVPWTEPVVFRRMQISAQGNSAGGVKIGSLRMRYEQLGYLQQDSAA